MLELMHTSTSNSPLSWLNHTGLNENAARPAASAAVGVEGLAILAPGDTSLPFPSSGATFEVDDISGLSTSFPLSSSVGGGEYPQGLLCAHLHWSLHMSEMSNLALQIQTAERRGGSK